jgi:hypothetical protein
MQECGYDDGDYDYVDASSIYASSLMHCRVSAAS